MVHAQMMYIHFGDGLFGVIFVVGLFKSLFKHGLVSF